METIEAQSIINQEEIVPKSAAEQLMDRQKAIQNSPLLKFMDSVEFHSEGVGEDFMADIHGEQRMPKIPEDLPVYFQALYKTPLLTREQENHLFRKYNYLKFLAHTLFGGLNRNCPEMRVIDSIEDLLASAAEVRNMLIRANLRLVVSIAKKYCQYGEARFDSMVSDGNISLMKAVEGFDYMRGYKLSTYATWAIKHNAGRKFHREKKEESHYDFGPSGYMDELPDRRLQGEGVNVVDIQNDIANAIRVASLDEREIKVINLRFGLGGNTSHTLQEVGDTLGLTREWIRMIEKRAKQKIQNVLENSLPRD